MAKWHDFVPTVAKWAALLGAQTVSSIPSALESWETGYEISFCSWEPPSQEGALGMYCIAAEKHWALMEIWKMPQWLSTRLSITIISKIHIIWNWWHPGSLASVSSQLSFTWSCEINYMQQIPTADKFFSICFPIREKKSRITFKQQLHKQVLSLKTKEKKVRMFSGIMPKILR